MRRIFWAALLSAGLCGCGEDSQDEASSETTGGQVLPTGGALTTYSVCSTTMTKAKVLSMFNGNLVFVSENRDKGSSMAEMIQTVVVNILANGLDFSSPYNFSFEGGDYTYANDAAGYTFSLYFAEAFGSFQAGDKIPYNLFDPDSFVTDVSVSGFPSLSVDYEEGPLFDLVEGSVDFDVASLSSFSIKLRLAGEKIKFSLASAGDYNGQAPRTQDVLHLVIANTPLTLTAIADQIAASGFGMSYTGTTYDSVYYDVEQDFVDTTFYIKLDDTGYFWEGPFNSVVTKNGVTMWQSGLLSQRQQNYAAYYCDESKTDLLGTATHDLDLQGGTFEFYDGTTLRYGLQGF